MKIVVNGTAREVVIGDGTPPILTYDEVVAIGALPHKPRQAVYSVTWRAVNRDGWARAGTLAPGQTLELLDGMVISAFVTDNA